MRLPPFVLRSIRVDGRPDQRMPEAYGPVGVGHRDTEPLRLREIRAGVLEPGGPQQRKCGTGGGT